MSVRGLGLDRCVALGGGRRAAEEGLVGLRGELPPALDAVEEATRDDRARAARPQRLEVSLDPRRLTRAPEHDEVELLGEGWVAGVAFALLDRGQAPNVLLTSAPTGVQRVDRGVALGDVDGDGAEDLFASGGVGPHSLFRNNGDGTFADWSHVLPGVVEFVSSATFADIDGDGDDDLLLSHLLASRGLTLWRNDEGVFVDVTGEAGLSGFVTEAAWSVTFADVDHDPPRRR